MSAPEPADPMEELAAIIREAMLDRGLVEADLERLVHGEVDRAAITRIDERLNQRSTIRGLGLDDVARGDVDEFTVPQRPIEFDPDGV